MDIKILNDLATIPTYGTSGAAGADLYAATDEDIVISPGETKLIGTGIAMAIPRKYFGAIFPRSGLAVKQGLRLANSVAVIDEDYRGEVKVALHNDSDIDQTVPAKARIAQLVIMPYNKVLFNEVDNLDSTERGEGGFGSTGLK